jgi:molybdopterin-guanine dinucleotide biosynthesis protein A
MSMPHHPPTLGVILAGGQARRMGGGDKGLRSLGGRSIMARLRGRIEPQVRSIILNANGDPGRFADLGLVVVPDDIAGQPGPLAGILAALDHASTVADVDWLVSVPCDAPFVPPDLVVRLHAARGTAQGAVAVSAGRRHPTVALWPISSRATLRRALVDDAVRRVDAVVARLGLAEVEWPAEPFDPFVNVNHPEDVAAAEAILTAWPQA